MDSMVYAIQMQTVQNQGVQTIAMEPIVSQVVGELNHIESLISATNNSY